MPVKLVKIVPLLVAQFLLFTFSVDAKIPEESLLKTFVDLEQKLDARLGVSMLDTQTGYHWIHRANEIFPMMSTFKVIACAAVLSRVDRGRLSLSDNVTFGQQEMVDYSPVVEKHLEKGSMTVAQLCDATMTLSDNTAGNLVLSLIGGPNGYTSFVRHFGDETSRLDRIEPALNSAIPGDVRDTSTPHAMMTMLQKLVLGDVLSTSSREQLTQWLIDDKVSGALLRAGLPSDWRIGDKTGAGENGSRALIAVMWPPQRKPIIAAIYITQTTSSMADSNAAIATMGRELAKIIASE